nr:SdrD B-like domain-containing protein [Prochloraceae cyanobacterium]
NAISLPVTVPATATLGNTFARFRYSSDNNLTPGGAASDGEVEDYQIAIAPSAIPPTISGTIFEDLNGDDFLTGGEPGLGAGITVRLLDSVSRQELDITTSDVNGQYSFINVPNGDYLVQLDTDTAPNGFVFGDTSNNIIININNNTATVNYPFDAANISGRVFEDTNLDDIQNGGETGLSDITVFLFNDIGNDGTPDGAAIATTVTDFAGDYGFNVPNGNYLVQVDTNDPDLVGRPYGGVTGNPNDPLNLTRNADINNNILFDLNYPFDPGTPPAICDATDPNNQLSFLQAPQLISGTDLQVGALYRFGNVFPSVDALVQITAFNGGASLLILDDNSTGEVSAFQPSLNAPNAAGTSSVDFEITFVNAGTNIPVALTFKAAGLDIDGNQNNPPNTENPGLREFIELTNISSFTLDPNTLLIATSIPPDGTRFESSTTQFQPGVSLNAVEALALAQYDNVSLFRYSIGAINNTNAGGQRLNSFFLACGSISPPSIDYGDAPDTYGTDSLAGNSTSTTDPVGASHNIVGGIQLGAIAPDAEPDGQPSVDATADGADEDGVLLGATSLQGQTVNQGDNITLDITTAGAGVLNAWIDWNGDGDFNDPGEQIATNVSPTANAISLPVTVPATATLGNTFARFRYSSDNNLTPGGAASDGEVEDYQIAIAPPPTISGTVFQGGVGIQNIIVELLDNSGAALATTTTAADGTYSFDASSLINGNYTVRVFDPPLGQVQNLDPDGTLDSETLINFAGADIINLNFGYDNAPPPPIIACNAPLSRFDWGTGATEQDYPIGVTNTPQNYTVNGANITVNVIGDPNLLVASPTPSPAVPDTPEDVARFTALGISGGGIGNESLLFDVDSPQLTSINDTSPVVFEYSFDGLLTDVRFAIVDIDTPGTNLESDPNERIDRVVIRGFAGAVEVSPILIPDNPAQATFSVSGNTATASTDNIGDGSSETEDFGTLNVYFDQAIDRFTVTYSEAIGIYYGITTNTGTPRNPQTRAIAIGDILTCIVPPTIDLDGDDSSGATGNDFTNLYTPAAGTLASPAQTAAADLDVAIADDGTNISAATIILTNRPNGDAAESLSIDPTAGGTVPAGLVTASAYNQATGTITLTGSATIAQYQAIISTLSYSNTNIEPGIIDTDRIITVQVTDSNSLLSNIATTTIRINTETSLVPNPDFNVSCNGANIAVILDSSGSIDNTEAEFFRNAFRTLLNELGTLGDGFTNLGIVEFGTTAKLQFDFTPLTTGPSGSIETTFENYITNIYPERAAIGSATNWEAALRETNNSLTAANILLFLTDGDPNTVIRNDNGQTLGTGEADPRSLREAVPWANLIKSRGTHIYAFGVDGVNPNKFSDITDGPNTLQFVPDPNNAPVADFDFITNFPAFPPRLRALIGGICNITPPPPELLLVKRITAINGANTTVNGDNLAIFNDDPADPNDNNFNWPDPNTNLIGGINGGEVQPGDEVEYTVYFLSTGGSPASNVRICDVIPTDATFVTDSFNSTSGIGLGLANTAIDPIPTAPTDLLSNRVNDGDRGDFYPQLSQTPDVCKANPQDPPASQTPLTAANNTSGAVVVNVVNNPDSLPNALGPGNPANSYGFIRFRVRVK